MSPFVEFDQNRAIRRTIFLHRTFDVVVCSLELHDIGYDLEGSKVTLSVTCNMKLSL